MYLANQRKEHLTQTHSQRHADLASYAYDTTFKSHRKAQHILRKREVGKYLLAYSDKWALPRLELLNLSLAVSLSLLEALYGFEFLETPNHSSYRRPRIPPVLLQATKLKAFVDVRRTSIKNSELHWLICIFLETLSMSSLSVMV